MPSNNFSGLLEAVRNLKQSPSTKIHKDEVTDWKELKVGDVVRSIQGYGPYFENAKGEKTFQGSYGYYRVDTIAEDGFYGYEHSPRGKKLDFGGRRFIYMGEPKKVDVINRQPHKLVKVFK